MQFPSVEWFEAVSKEVNSETDRFRRLGFCDATIMFRLRQSGLRFVVTFEDYGVTEVRELTSTEEADVDFELAGDDSVWHDMIENIRANGEADLEHTLNRLQLPGTLELIAADQHKADLFYRYNQTFQEFFNLSSRIKTEFAESV